MTGDGISVILKRRMNNRVLKLFIIFVVFCCQHQQHVFTFITLFTLFLCIYVLAMPL